MTGKNYTPSTKSESSPSDEKKKWSEGSTLPEHFDSVSDILAKINEKDGTKAETDKESAVAVAKEDASPVTETKVATQAVEKEKLDVVEKAPACPVKHDIKEVKSDTKSTKVLEPDAGLAKSVTDKVVMPVASMKPSGKSESLKKSSGSTSKSSIPDSLGPKQKLQRVLGVVDMTEAKSPFEKQVYVYDPSVYMLPKPKKVVVPVDPSEELAKAEKLLEEVMKLRDDLENQAHWDAVRLQKAVYAQALEDKKTAAIDGATQARRHMDALTKMKNEALEHYKAALEVRTREIATEMESRRESEVAALLAERERALRTELDVKYLERELAAAAEREEKLREARASVDTMTDRFDELVAFNAASRRAAASAAAAFALAERAATDKPFADVLDGVAGRSELASAVAATVPREAAEYGVDTVEQLRNSFKKVGRRALDASMVPEESPDTLWAHLLAVVMARLKISRFELPAAYADNKEPDRDEDRVRYAQTLVNGGDLDKAVTVLEQVEKKLPKQILKDWVDAARSRCIVNNATKVLFADASIAQIALSNLPVDHPGAATSE